MVSGGGCGEPKSSSLIISVVVLHPLMWQDTLQCRELSLPEGQDYFIMCGHRSHSRLIKFVKDNAADKSLPLLTTPYKWSGAAVHKHHKQLLQKLNKKIRELSTYIVHEFASLLSVSIGYDKYGPKKMSKRI